MASRWMEGGSHGQNNPEARTNPFDEAFSEQVWARPCVPTASSWIGRLRCDQEIRLFLRENGVQSGNHFSAPDEKEPF
ncbi:MAG: hypothetical protein ACP5FH_08295 [Terracidiphilus sp.]